MLGYLPCSADYADMCLVVHFAHLFFPFHGSRSSVKNDVKDAIRIKCLFFGASDVIWSFGKVSAII